MRDILLDSEFDLSIEQGDFAVGEDLEQRIVSIAQAERGHYKQWPLVGAEIGGALNAPAQKTNQNLRLQLEADGLRVKSIRYSEQKLIVDADYKS